jgi:hypothetical protein
VLWLVSAEEQGIFGDAAMLERRELDVDNGLVLGFLLGQGTTHKHFSTDVFASTNSFQLVYVGVFKRSLCILFSFLLSLN